MKASLIAREADEIDAAAERKLPRRGATTILRRRGESRAPCIVLRMTKSARICAKMDARGSTSSTVLGTMMKMKVLEMWRDPVFPRDVPLPFAPSSYTLV